MLANILTAGTVLFVFISGFLFHQVFYPWFDFRWFLTKKQRSKATPYLLWFTLALVLNLLTHTPLPDRFVGPGPSLWDQWPCPCPLAKPGKGDGISFCQSAFFVVRSLLTGTGPFGQPASRRTRLSAVSGAGRSPVATRMMLFCRMQHNPYPFFCQA